MSRKMMLVLATIVAVVLSAAATALAASPNHNNDSAIKGNSAKNKDLAGLIGIGGRREMYMECRGKGSPTVVFVSGGRGPGRNLERDARPIQTGGVARDSPDQPGVRLRPSRDLSRDG